MLYNQRGLWWYFAKKNLYEKNFERRKIVRSSRQKESEVQEWDIDCILSSIASKGMCLA